MYITPSITAPLDPEFIPAVLWNHAYIAAAEATRRATPVVIALEREAGVGALTQAWKSDIHMGAYCAVLPQKNKWQFVSSPS